MVAKPTDQSNGPKLPDPLSMFCVSEIPHRWICTRCMVEMTGAEAECKQPTCRLSFRVCGIPASNTSSARKQCCKSVPVPSAPASPTRLQPSHGRSDLESHADEEAPSSKAQPPFAACESTPPSRSNASFIPAALFAEATANHLRTATDPLVLVDAAAKSARVPFSPRGQCPPSFVEALLPTAFVTPPSKQAKAQSGLPSCCKWKDDAPSRSSVPAHPSKSASREVRFAASKESSAPLPRTESIYGDRCAAVDLLPSDVNPSSTFCPSERRDVASPQAAAAGADADLESKPAPRVDVYCDAAERTFLAVETARDSCHAPSSWSELLAVSDADFEQEIANLYDDYVAERGCGA